jgi:hypothetical protein
MVGGYHDLYLGSRLTLGFTRLAVAAGITFAALVAISGAQVVVPYICQFDALEDPEDRPPSVVDSMLSGLAARQGRRP